VLLFADFLGETGKAHDLSGVVAGMSLTRRRSFVATQDVSGVLEADV
jgi:hypothetical protein